MKEKQSLQDKSLYLPKEISSLVNVEEEDTSEDTIKPLKEIANNKDVALMAFIAPYVSKRVSPTRELRAVIGLAEEFGIEMAISQICSKPSNKKRLYLLVNSPGGLVTSSYKIARELRRNFNHITVFILHTAASGGALMTMAGNEVVMGDMANLTPIDVQVDYKGEMVSANTMEIAILKLDDYFKDKLPDEATYPWQLLAQKIDPILREDWNTRMSTIRLYAREILIKSRYNSIQRDKIIANFVYTVYEHSLVIHRDRARLYGLNVVENPELNNVLEKMRPWLSKHMLNKEGRHIIRYILPDGKKEELKSQKGSKQE